MKLWRAAGENAPNDPGTAAGYIGALISAGGIEEAAALAAALVQRHPKDENGPVALARIAELRGNYAAAIDHWEAVLALKPNGSQALIRLGGALLKAGRFGEALACAKRLEAVPQGMSQGAILRAQAVRQERGFADARPIWESGLARFGNDATFLRAYGSALLDAGAFDECLDVVARLRKSDLHGALSLEGALRAKRMPYQDNTGFWKKASAQLPESVDLTRKLLHAALSAREMNVASATFDRLLQQDRLTVRDADMLVGLVNADLQSGDRAAGRKKIRAYLKHMRGLPGYRGAALRLHRAILTCFPDRSDSARRISANIPLFVNMVHKARLGADATEPLEQIAAAEETVQKCDATCLLDSDVDADACPMFIKIVREQLRTGTPFSFIRLGDGEANAFQQTSSFAAQSDADAAEREKVWWGRTLDTSARNDLAARVRQAALDADAIGFPTREWFLRDVRLNTGAALAATKSGRGLLVVAEAITQQARSGALSNKMLTSAHLPQDLQRWDLYPELFKGVDQVVLISCHPSLPEVLREHFGIATLKHVLVPPGDSMREMQHRALTDEELPPRSLARALDDLGDSPKGILVLVGAGYAGKILIAEAKKRGGIALDLGSIFDHWLGQHTRSYQDLA